MLSDLIFRLRSLFRRSAVENELDDELQFHLEQQVEKHVRSGLTREEAMRQTRLEFGGLGHVKEDCRESRGITFLETTARDIRYALRQLREDAGIHHYGAADTGAGNRGECRDLHAGECGALEKAACRRSCDRWCAWATTTIAAWAPGIGEDGDYAMFSTDTYRATEEKCAGI